VLKAHSRSVNAASFSPDGKRVVTASDDRTARLWDAETGKKIAVLKAHTNWVRSASFSPDGKRVVTASFDNTARLWDAETGKEIAVLKAHNSWVRSASFSPDGKRVVTASDDETARLWDASTGAEIAVLKAHSRSVNAASFSPDGKRVVTASDDQTARLWDAETGAEIAVLGAHSRSVNAASFSPDGKRVVTASDDQTARLWDAETGAEITVLRAHSRSVNAASFSPDGRRVVTGSDDDTGRIHDVSRIEAVTRGRAIVLTAALARAIGWRTAPEAADFLMQDAPDDLFATALRYLGRNTDNPELQATIAALHAPLHPNCYLSPTQLAETFGLATPQRATAAPSPPRTRRPRIGLLYQRQRIEAHLGKLAPDAPIRALVAQPALDDRLKAYEDADADALAAQSRYRTWGRFALKLMLIATLIASLMLLPLEKLIPYSEVWRGFVSGTQSVANLTALLVVWWLKKSDAVGRWLRNRAIAEQQRGDYFRALLAASPPTGADPRATLRQKLDLFEAAHLDNQRGFFDTKLKAYANPRFKQRWPGLVAKLAIAAGITLGGLAALRSLGVALPEVGRLILAVLDDPLRWQLGFNTIASALLAYVSAEALLSQDERNRSLYGASLEKLNRLRSDARRQAVAAAAAAGDEAAVMVYAAEAQAILDADHQAWMLTTPADVPPVLPAGRG
jgi:hypothetical protein